MLQQESDTDIRYRWFSVMFHQTLGESIVSSLDPSATHQRTTPDFRKEQKAE